MPPNEFEFYHCLQCVRVHMCVCVCAEWWSVCVDKRQRNERRQSMSQWHNEWTIAKRWTHNHNAVNSTKTTTTAPASKEWYALASALQKLESSAFRSRERDSEAGNERKKRRTNDQERKRERKTSLIASSLNTATRFPCVRSDVWLCAYELKHYCWRHWCEKGEWIHYGRTDASAVVSVAHFAYAIYLWSVKNQVERR